MEHQIDNITPRQRIAECDKRQAARGSKKSGERESPNDGWTWFATGLIAALLVVSGYMDQESGIFEESSTAAQTESYASIFAAPQLMFAGAQVQK